MSERSEWISKLLSSQETRTAYIKSKLGVLVPSQIRALRLQSEMPRQSDLAKAANLHQSRISMFETPGAANVTIETLARLAAAFKVGIVVKFVPMSEMLQWENGYSQDAFNIKPLDEDVLFLEPELKSNRLTERYQLDRPMVAGLEKRPPQCANGLPTTKIEAGDYKEILDMPVGMGAR